MKIFETERLTINVLKEKDQDIFVELLSDPRIIDPAPHQTVDMENILKKFRSNLKLCTVPIKNQDNIWGVFEKGNSEMIGITAILTNAEGDWELGYRFRIKHWGHGFGTEVASGTVKYCFEKLNFEKITADVDIENIASVKILEKTMFPVKEFYNEEDQCTDRRYEIKRKDWPQYK
ncbi:GNAT family N-acetyltransferase [Aquimarina sp. 2201CG1-2-11]|uniref:GNAT family N-acetyltransferase n=1 Tax=Aquimarina discodermiae TaxID=3231043 RepID=UPI0034628006